MHQPYQGVPQNRQPSNGWAVAAIVVAGVAFVFGWVPFVGLLLGAGAVALGIVAILKARPLFGRGKGLGITSVVLGGLAALTSVIITAFALVAGSSTDTAGPPTSLSTATPGSEPSAEAPSATGSATPAPEVTSTAPAPEPTTSAPAPAAPTPGIGVPVVSGDLTFTVNAFTCGIERVGDRSFGADAQGQFCQVDLSVLNNGQRANYFTSTQATLLSASGQEFSASSDSVYLDGGAGLLDQINPGNTLSGSLLFDVPDGADLSALQLRDGLFDEPVTVPV